MKSWHISHASHSDQVAIAAAEVPFARIHLAPAAVGLIISRQSSTTPALGHEHGRQCEAGVGGDISLCEAGRTHAHCDSRERRAERCVRTAECCVGECRGSAGRARLCGGRVVKWPRMAVEQQGENGGRAGSTPALYRDVMCVRLIRVGEVAPWQNGGVRETKAGGESGSGELDGQSRVRL